MDQLHLRWLIVHWLFGFQLFLPNALANWNYGHGREGPGNWSRSISPLCGGKKQSPIAIWLNELELLLVPQDLPYLHFTNLNKSINQARIENNGRSVQVTLPKQANVTVSGGPLHYEYKLRQFHFHWAEMDELGSEHTFGQTHYPVEAHFVHTHNEPIANSTKNNVYIAVMAVFFKLKPDTYADSTPLANLSEFIKQMAYRGDEAELNFPINIDDFYPQRHNSYISYTGSLTTPPCTENVQWLLFTDPMPITHSQINSFRNLHSSREDEADKWLQHNFRPVQKRNDRIVHYVQERPLSDGKKQLVSKIALIAGLVFSIYNYQSTIIHYGF